MTREDAIEHLKEWKGVISSGYRKAVIDMAIKALSAEVVHKPDYSYEADMVRRLKEAMSEPKTGEWIECGTNTDGTHNIKCDQCGAGFRTRGHANSHNTKERFKWCPTCGARMLGEDGEA